MIGIDQRVAIVVSHPAHLLTVLGMVLRCRPHILMLLEAPTGPGAGQEGLVREGLALAGLDNQCDALRFDEDESYRRALAGDHGFHLELGAMIRDWLQDVKPDVVLGDAYEASNFQHDIGRLLLDEALRFHDRPRTISNFEFPLTSRLPGDGNELRFGEFLTGTWETFSLTPREADVKRSIVDWAREHDPFVNDVADFFPDLAIEPFRPVPRDRNYLEPPPGLDLYYDERGREEVKQGKYETVITFQDHYVPLVEAVLASRSNRDMGNLAA